MGREGGMQFDAGGMNETMDDVVRAHVFGGIFCRNI